MPGLPVIYIEWFCFRLFLHNGEAVQALLLIRDKDDVNTFRPILRNDHMLILFCCSFVYHLSDAVDDLDTGIRAAAFDNDLLPERIGINPEVIVPDIMNR